MVSCSRALALTVHICALMQAIVGYTLAALDSTDFYPRLVKEWLPGMAKQYSRACAGACVLCAVPTRQQSAELRPCG